MIVKHIEGPWRGKPMLEPPKGIIIHAMGEYVNNMYAPDFMKSVGMSIHAFVAVDGKILLASDQDTIAFHAGKSAFGHFQDLNNFFLGIEILVEGHHNMATFRKAIEEGDPYKEEQYIAVGHLCATWISQFQIDRQFLVGHSDVAGPSVRKDPKVDPGRAFDWQKLKSYIDEYLMNPLPIASDDEEE